MLKTNKRFIIVAAICVFTVVLMSFEYIRQYYYRKQELTMYVGEITNVHIPSTEDTRSLSNSCVTYISDVMLMASYIGDTHITIFDDKHNIKSQIEVHVVTSSSIGVSE